MDKKKKKVSQKEKESQRIGKIKEKFDQTADRLELAMDAGEHGFWDWDLDTDEIYFSPQYYKMLGYKPNELPMTKETWVNLMHPEDRKTIVPKIEKYVKNAESYEEIFRLKCNDGCYKWISGRGKSFEIDENGNSHRAVGVHVDVTKIKEIEKELLLQKELTQSSLDSLSAHIAVLDSKGVIRYTNKAWKEFSKKNNSSFDRSDEGVNYLKVCKNAEGQWAKEALAAYQGIKKVIGRKNNIFSLEYPCHSPDTNRWFRMRVTPFIGDGPYKVVVTHENITERKKQEEKIKKQRERMEYILVGTEAGTWEWNVQTGETVFNEKWAEMIGYTLEEISPTNNEIWEKFAHPDDLEKSKEMLQKHFNGMIDQYEIEIRMRHKEGHWVWLLDKGKVISWTDDGKPLKMFGIHLDITKRKEKEKELQKKRQRLNTLISKTPAIIYSYELVDGMPNITYINKNIKNVLGFEPEYFIDNFEKFKECLHPEDTKQAFVDILKLITKEGRDSIILEYRFADKQGKYHWLRDEQNLIIYGDGSKEVIGACWDITEIKEQRAYFEQLFYNSTEAIVLLDNNHHVIKTNKKFESLFGFKESEIKNKNLDNYILPDNLINEGEEYTEKVKKGEKIEEECPRKIKNGKNVDVHMQGFPIKLGNGHIGIYAIYRDITERRKREKNIESLHKIALNFKKLSDKKEVCKSTVEAAENLLQFDICDVNLVEDEMLIPRAKTNNTNNKKMPITKGIAGKTYRENESFLIDNIEKAPKAKPVESSYKSLISIPIGDYGVFQAVAEEVAAFTEADLELAELLISHTTAALERIYSQERLKYKTFHDELTGLYNRRFIEEEMQRLDTKRQLPISIIMADINGLKIINDSLGHAKGDKLLVKTANLLEDTVRNEDILTRYGGDEFIILLPQTSQKIAQDIIGRIKKSCKETKTEELIVSLGIGAATKSDSKVGIKNIIKKADNNLYKDKLMSSRSIKHEIVENLLNTLTTNSSETIGHAQRMKELAQKLGTKIGLNKSQLNRLSLLAILHDIGKITISSDILTKPDKLTEEEWQLLKKHPEKGHKIVSASEKFAIIAEEILYHHEYYNGNGYPEGLTGEEIPFLARIIAIVDAYDVMTTGRPYQDAMSKQKVLKEIKSCAGTQFDPKLAEEFVEMMSE